MEAARRRVPLVPVRFAALLTPPPLFLVPIHIHRGSSPPLFFFRSSWLWSVHGRPLMRRERDETPRSRLGTGFHPVDR